MFLSKLYKKTGSRDMIKENVKPPSPERSPNERKQEPASTLPRDEPSFPPLRRPFPCTCRPSAGAGGLCGATCRALAQPYRPARNMMKSPDERFSVASGRPGRNGAKGRAAGRGSEPLARLYDFLRPSFQSGELAAWGWRWAGNEVQAFHIWFLARLPCILTVRDVCVYSVC